MAKNDKEVTAEEIIAQYEGREEETVQDPDFEGEE